MMWMHLMYLYVVLVDMRDPVPYAIGLYHKTSIFMIVS